MATIVEDVRETLTGQPRRRWLPWRRKPTLTERVGGVTEQVGQTASGLAEQVGQTATDLTGQVAQTTGHLMQRLKGTPAARAGRGDAESLLSMGELSGGADLPAERAAVAAEAASLAAQQAAGAVERLGGWLALLASRTPQPLPLQARQEGMPETALAVVPEQEEGKQGRGVTGSVKRAAMKMGQRLSDLSDGRYGLEAQPPKAETKQGKKAAKRLERQARKEAKAEQPGAGIRWLPWVVGLSLGLVIGVVGVAYWQRRRLQEVWTQTSQRVQQTTEAMRQRLESSRAQQPGQTSIAPEATSLGPLGSAAQVSESDRQVDGRIESTWQ